MEYDLDGLPQHNLGNEAVAHPSGSARKANLIPTDESPAVCC
jgi:hypothetical protein